MRALALLLVLPVLAAGCGGSGKHAPSTSSAASTTTTTPAAAAQPVRVAIQADSHYPRVGRRWHSAVRVTDAA